MHAYIYTRTRAHTQVVIKLPLKLQLTSANTLSHRLGAELNHQFRNGVMTFRQWRAMQAHQQIGKVIFDAVKVRNWNIEHCGKTIRRRIVRKVLATLVLINTP